jgi:predicted MFS family arabinose efflux permease
LYLSFLFLTILFAFCFFQLFTIQPVFYKTQWHLNEQFIGILMALNGVIIVVIEMVLVYTLEGTKPLTHFIRIGILLVAFGYALLNLLPAAKITGVFIITLITIGEILSMPFMNSFWISRTSENNRGQYAGMYTIAWSIAQITGPSLGSQVAAHAGFTTLWWLLAGICVIASIGFSLMGRFMRVKIIM